MANILVRLVDRIGEGTLSSAEQAYRKAAELSLVFKEQDAVATALLERKKQAEEDKRRAMEEKLSMIKEAVSTEIPEPQEVEPEFHLEREELEVPFLERLANVISDLFSGYAAAPSSFFRNIQEDLYKANILMPASKYVALALGVSVISGLVMGVILSLALASTLGVAGGLMGLVLGGLIGIFVFVFSKIYPRSKIKGRSDSFSRELPFALRHMSTQLTSGSGLLETMRSVSRSDYGVLSEEFKRAILEIERGATIEEAYERMNLRIESPGLKKASRQITSTLRTGGNLANTLKIIAEEVSNEMRMKLKDFIQVLNTFTLMYMFIVVVAPVLITTMVIAMGIAMKGLPLPADVMWLLYAAFLGISIYMSVMVKRFEPKV
ncbi:MAG: type II secretion system F family protein [Candidatus Hydrothermarchaeaceae archaeon]